MEGIQRTFQLKDYKIDEPKDYLGATLEKMILLDKLRTFVYVIH